MKIAAAQLAPKFLNKKETVNIACKAITEAGKNGAKLLVFPEAYLSGYPDWVWLIPNSKGAILNELYLELVKMLSQCQMKLQQRFVKPLKPLI